MRALESNVDCRLLSKLGKKVILTEALLQHAGPVLEEIRQARLTLNALSKWGFRRLRVAAEVGLCQPFLKGIIVKFHQDFPRSLMSVDLAMRKNRCRTTGLNSFPSSPTGSISWS